jgi:hypothetical protein
MDYLKIKKNTEHVPPFRHGYELHGSNKIHDIKFDNFYDFKNYKPGSISHLVPE